MTLARDTLLASWMESIKCDLTSVTRHRISTKYIIYESLQLEAMKIERPICYVIGKRVHIRFIGSMTPYTL